MKIINNPQPPGIYCDRFLVNGLNEKGKPTWFIILHNQASTFQEAIKFWKESWGKKGCKAFYIKNSEPVDPSFYYAA